MHMHILYFIGSLYWPGHEDSHLCEYFADYAHVQVRDMNRNERTTIRNSFYLEQIYFSEICVLICKCVCAPAHLHCVSLLKVQRLTKNFSDMWKRNSF